MLETFTDAAKEIRERTAAVGAVADLRAGRKPVDDFNNLRPEVLDLQQANRDLRKELEIPKKKAEAKETTPTNPVPKKKLLAPKQHLNTIARFLRGSGCRDLARLMHPRNVQRRFATHTE